MTRAYFLTENVLRYAASGSWVAAQAIGLGLLDADSLERITVSRFPTGRLGEEYNKSGLFRWEREALEFFPPTGRILVGAAGAGREMIALHEAGYAVDGFDCSRPLVDAGQEWLRRAGCTGRLEWAPPSCAPEWTGPYDGAIMGLNGYMYIPSGARRRQLLAGFARLLAPDAPLVLSFEQELGRVRQMQWSARAANWIRRLRGAPPVEVGDFLQGGFKHHFQPPQIREEMASAGFEMVWYTRYGHGWAAGRKRGQ